MAEHDTSEGGAFPTAWYVGFLRYLDRHRDRIRVVTYDQMSWPPDEWGLSAYELEYRRWRLVRDPKMIEVVLQHDVDSHPERTEAMLRHEQQFDLCSNVMVFQRRVDRALLRDEGRVAFTDYALDDDYLRRRQDEGVVIGYHSNAYEAAGFDLNRATVQFERDVDALRGRFTIRHFSPHGGVRDQDGRSNSALAVPESLRGSLRWVHNGRSPAFAGTYSDGGLMSRPPEQLDLFDFVRRWTPGMRYRVLVHPQYYVDAPRALDRLAGRRWYDEALSGRSGWDELRPRSKSTIRATAHRGDALLRNLGTLAGNRARRAWSGDRGAVAQDWKACSPVLVRAMSRSGGTLTVTVFDAHPDIAMSYELYPGLLNRRAPASAFEAPERRFVPAAERLLAGARNLRGAARLLQHNDLRLFFVRCMRSGLTEETVGRLYQQHLEEGYGFEDALGQLRFVERCCVTKMEHEGKRLWGMKCLTDFDTYLRAWPQARFVNVIRDGRDVLASQANTGAFEADPRKVGSDWATNHRKFREFALRTEAHAYELSYEKLATDPEAEVRRMCERLQLPFHPSMMGFHQSDLTIFRASHLSMDRITKPIDTSQIGRWKRDLSPEQLDGFLAGAGEAFSEFGYH